MQQEGRVQFDTLLTAQEVASLMRVHLRTFQRWCRDGQGPREVRLGNVYRYAEGDVRSWIATRQVERDEDVA